MVAERICALDEYRQASFVLGYVPLRTEVDISLVMDRAAEEGHELHYNLWKGMSHVFPVQPIREARQVLPDILYDIA